VVTKQDGHYAIELKQTHVYYAQIQGQMAITDRKWCDFVVYTSNGISIGRVTFYFWKNTILPKLVNFHDNVN